MTEVLGAYVAGLITFPVVAGWGLWMVARGWIVGPRPRQWRRGR